MTTEISSRPFGITRSGEPIDQYLMTNQNGIEVGVVNYGGIINTLRVPDRRGDLDDIVLGYDSLAEYENCSMHFGCIAGRYANRIAGGQFTIDGQGYQLETNHGPHHLHGASAGFGKVIWAARAIQGSESAAVMLHYRSVDGHGGYPGNLEASVVYRLSDSDRLDIEYRCTTDKATILNLTNHSYFNLRGHQFGGVDGVLEHQLCLHADQFVATDRLGIPLGGVSDVTGTPLDFRQVAKIGARLQDYHLQLENGHGFDHTWVPIGQNGTLRPAASVFDPVSGRSMVVETTMPGVQFYSGNHISDCDGKSGARYGRRGALCLETQYFPDSPNQPDFPDSVLRPGAEWSEQSSFYFGIDV